MKFFRITFLFLVGITLLISCKKTGCTDPEALNYLESASKDDHSCYYFWIGQHHEGGDIFYIDKTRKHGLITARFDLLSTPWGCYGTIIQGADDRTVGGGLQNSLDILAGCGPNTPAGMCLALDTLGYNDWYLPSIEELKGLSKTLGKVGQANLGSGYYWTSTEVDTFAAYLVLFGNGGAETQNTKTGLYDVRAIRSF